VIQLPDYFVRKVSGYPGGIRMPKMTTWWQDGSSSTGWPRPMLPFGGVLHGEGDPLSGGDYRYWCGAMPTMLCRKGYASCRACGEVVMYKDARKEHKKAGCGNKLEEAFKMLRRSTECVICKLPTHRKVYGLPMCCKDCEFEWEFTTTTPKVLRYCLDDL
jgi:hypothetical protein